MNEYHIISSGFFSTNITYLSILIADENGDSLFIICIVPIRNGWLDADHLHHPHDLANSIHPHDDLLLPTNLQAIHPRLQSRREETLLHAL